MKGVCERCGGPTYSDKRWGNQPVHCRNCYHEHYRESVAVPKLDLSFAVRGSLYQPTEEQVIPLLLYRGSVTFSRAQALYKYTASMMEAGITTFDQAMRVSREQEDFRHISGLHAALSSTGGLTGFIGRLLDHPEITDITPHFTEYVNDFAPSVRWLYHLEPIAPKAEHYKAKLAVARPWRYERHIRVLRPKQPKPEALPPLPQVWPFISGGPKDEHAMLLAIDAAVPRGLPEMVRQDVCQDLAVAVLTGDIDISDLVNNAGEFVKKVWRQYPLKYGPMSLDKPAPWAGEDDGRSLGDLLVPSW